MPEFHFGKYKGLQISSNYLSTLLFFKFISETS